jgi:hypothetical protein
MALFGAEIREAWPTTGRSCLSCSTSKSATEKIRF